MSIIWTIAAMEFRRLFHSPLAWVVLALVQFVLAWVFLLGLNEYLTQVMPRMAGRENAPGITDLVVSAVWLWAGLVMLAVMPVLTMRTFAEERMNHTLPLLTSAPVSALQLVLGKYLGLLGLLMLAVLMWALMPVSLALGTSLDWGRLLSGMLGLFLLLASFAAAGLYLSALASQPVVAAVSTIGLLIFLAVLYVSGSAQGSASTLFVYLSHFGHFLSFLEGMFDSSDLVYYLLFIGFFLGLAVLRMGNERFRG